MNSKDISSAGQHFPHSIFFGSDWFHLEWNVPERNLRMEEDHALWLRTYLPRDLNLFMTNLTNHSIKKWMHNFPQHELPITSQLKRTMQCVANVRTWMKCVANVRTWFRTEVVTCFKLQSINVPPSEEKHNDDSMKFISWQSLNYSVESLLIH